ncbi:hypothetical protein CRUP_007134 [Coryphaenoides rupestris]|nr:hypothetical protein CRUP_007134 [Coryphaenoides rupestris]
MQSPVRNAASYRPTARTPGQDADSPLPPFNERLAQLRPSRELLEFYRQKISQFDSEQEGLLQTLEKYRGVAEDQHKLQWEVRQREGETAELQKALSDMQVYLFQEREQSLRLYAENDRLKIRELEDRKKIQHLLALVGPDVGEITYFHREPPHKVTIPQKQPDGRSDDNLNLRPTKMRPGAAKERCARAVQVEALQAQMEEQARLAKEQVESLLEDRRIQADEGQVQHQRDQERIADLTDKLQRTQTLLYESTRDFLQLKFETRAHEKSWMAEKDRLLRELDTCQERLRKARSGMEDRPSTGTRRGGRPGGSCGATALLSHSQATEPQAQQSHREERKALQEDLKQAHPAGRDVQGAVHHHGDGAVANQGGGGCGQEIFKERSDKMAKRLQLMTQRYEALEKRRSMEAEGFKADLKLLRQKTSKDVEKQLVKVTLSVGPNQDLAILHEVKQTNSRTKKVQGELMALKAKIYGLENDLRFC